MPVTGEDAATSLEQKFEPGRSERKHRLFEKNHLTAGVLCPVFDRTVARTDPLPPGGIPECREPATEESQRGELA